MVGEGEGKEKDEVRGGLSLGSQPPLEGPSGLVDMPCLGCGGQIIEGGVGPLKETWSLREPPAKA